ncbi:MULTISPECIES: hypothetical protein [Paenibacillus]|uniref:hypothetical protein n=1 Tax=Paenibacillus TaxID=44249 RepID=UPI001476D46E|nr:hypothetical protein [Paenibacillus macerans]MED4956497.1 hypothetical protein [Paenibacillus macerans]UMV46038.1 hypothetical protein LMZ02_21435 [Paenibacillus macerans]
MSFEKIAAQISSIFPKLMDIAGITPFMYLCFSMEFLREPGFCSFSDIALSNAVSIL